MVNIILHAKAVYTACKGSNTSKKYPLPGLVYIFCLQRFSSIFERTITSHRKEIISGTKYVR